jgi:tRNA-modifying protein YgfZ
MSENWQEFLRQQGARMGDARVMDFGDAAAERRAARDGDILVDLSHFSLIRASGPDTRSFLNGQLTNDIAVVDDAHTQLSAWCNAKGRMLALFRIVRHNDGYLMQLPAALRDDIVKRLRMYVLRAKVKLDIADDALVRIGIAGPNALTRVTAETGLAPALGDNTCARAGELLVMRLPGIHPRFEILAPEVEARAIWSRLLPGATPAGADAWTWHDIMAGVPVVLPETSDTFVPQMANLDLLGGINFNKGCYTGQEIVARVHYLGRLKQRMYRLHAEATDVPPPGAAIYAPDRQDQSTGTVVVACAAPAGGVDMLAVVHTSSADAGDLHLGQPHGPRLMIESLPYSVS